MTKSVLNTISIIIMAAPPLVLALFGWYDDLSRACILNSLSYNTRLLIGGSVSVLVITGFILFLTTLSKRRES